MDSASRPVEDANARHELNEIRAGLSRALAGAVRLKDHGGLAPLGRQVAAMLAADIAAAQRRHEWLLKALDEREDVAA